MAEEKKVENKEPIIEFEAKMIQTICNKPNWKLYAMSVDTDKYPDIHLNKYDNCSIFGDIHNLSKDINYTIKAKEVCNNYGYSYQVLNIKRDVPISQFDILSFLQEILTSQQAIVLYNAYPDIVERVIENRLDDIDLNRTKGIKEITFNNIKHKIIANFVLVELVDKFQGIIPLNVIKKMYEKYCSVEVVQNKMNTEPYDCLCRLSGIGFKKADAMLIELDKKVKEKVAMGNTPTVYFDFDLKSSKQRCLSAIRFLLEENENDGNTKINVLSLRKKVDSLVPECSDYLVECLTGEDSLFLNKEEKTVALKNTYETELYIANAIKQGLLVENKWDIDIEKYRNVDGSLLTDEQMKTMQSVCDNNITILQGYGGTGKSFSAKALINMLKDTNKSFDLFAPTGRASKVLSAYTGCQAKTIHRGLGFKPPNEWFYNEECQMFSDVVILDETSMTDVFLFKHLLEAIDFKRTKLLLIGDDAQLPSVSCGNLLHDLLKCKCIPTVSLTKVFRYGIGGLSTVATDIRNSNTSFDASKEMEIIGNDKSFVWMNINQESAINKILSLYKKLINANVSQDDILILASQNVGQYGTQEINNKIQEYFNKNTESITVGESKYIIGDAVIQCTNNYKALVYDNNSSDKASKMYCDDIANQSSDNMSFEEKPNTTFISNGEIGTIVKIFNDSMVVNFNGVLVLLGRADMLHIKLAYAISIHKSQGGQAKHIIVFAPKSHTYMLNSNSLYVAVTRAKEKCYLFSEYGTFARAIKKKENFDRKTFLSDLISK